MGLIWENGAGKDRNDLSNIPIQMAEIETASKRIANKVASIRYGSLRRAESTEKVMSLREHLLAEGVWRERKAQEKT